MSKAIPQSSSSGKKMKPGEPNYGPGSFIDATRTHEWYLHGKHILNITKEEKMKLPGKKKPEIYRTTYDGMLVRVTEN